MQQIIASLIILLVLCFKPNALYSKVDSRFFDNHQYNALWVLADGRCVFCNVKLLPRKGNDRSGEADHIIAWSKGGETTISNGQMLCRKCNRKKGNK